LWVQQIFIILWVFISDAAGVSLWFALAVVLIVGVLIDVAVIGIQLAQGPSPAGQ
jgi:hypothetical protein